MSGPRPVGASRAIHAVLAALAVLLTACEGGEPGALDAAATRAADALPTTSDGSTAAKVDGAPGPTAAGSAAPSAPAPDSLPPPGDKGPTVVYLDLVAEALRAHVRRVGPVVDPAGPGFARVALLGDRKSWLTPPKGERGGLAWPEGIGTTFAFPVGAEGPSLRTGAIFIKGIAANQRVSLFIDEREAGTVAVPMAGRTVTFSLPPDGLAPGEHRLRLWFRFTRFIGKTRNRTPGGIGPLILSPDRQPEAAPPAWTGALKLEGAQHPALLAGPPSGWTFFVWLPEGARFSATAIAGEAPADFRLTVQGDLSDPLEMARVHVDAHQSVPLDIDLTRFARQPVRLALETTGTSRALATAGWADAALRMTAPPEIDVPGARNVIVWAVDGLRADRVSFGRGGGRAATPNLDLLMAEGGAADGIWSGGATAEEGHRRLLRPDPALPSIPAAFAAQGRFTGYFGGTPTIDPALLGEFTTTFDLRKTGDAPETRIVMRELASWIDVRKRQPFFAYVSTTDPKQAGEDAPGYTRLYVAAEREAQTAAEEARNAAQGTQPAEEDPAAEAAAEARARLAELQAKVDGQTSVSDYWVGQLVALLHAEGIANDTAVVVVGTVGGVVRLGNSDAPALVPEVLRVPLVVWHPGMLGKREHGLVSGGDLTDVAATILDLGGVPIPAATRGRSLATSLFFGSPIAPRANAAQLGPVQVARLGDWWLRLAPGRAAQLWNLADDPAGRTDLAAERPIALRLIRDAMQDDRPKPGRTPP